MKINKKIALCIILFSPLLCAMDKDYQPLSPDFLQRFSETDIREINALLIKPSPEYCKSVHNSLKEKYASTPAQKKSYQAVCRQKVEIAQENQRLEKIKEEEQKKEKKAREALQQKFEEVDQRKIAVEESETAYWVEFEKLTAQRQELHEKIALAKKANAQLKQKTAKPTQKKELTPAKLQFKGQKQLQKHFRVSNKPSLLIRLIYLCDDIWEKSRSNNKITGPYFDDKIHRLFGPVNTQWSYDFSPCTKKLLIKSEPYTIPSCNELCLIKNCNYYTYPERSTEDCYGCP